MLHANGMAAHTFETDLGPVRLRWTEAGLCTLRFPDPEADLPEDEAAPPAWVAEAAVRIRAHLGGAPQDLQALPVDLSGLTPFQRRLAEALRSTEPGEALTYGLLARLAGRPGAARAVGQAVARNPLLLLVPCHRVVSANGEGGWSAFGSLERLRRLRDLDREPGDTGS